MGRVLSFSIPLDLDGFVESECFPWLLQHGASWWWLEKSLVVAQPHVTPQDRAPEGAAGAEEQRPPPDPECAPLLC